MVLYVMKWDIRQETAADYTGWAKSALRRMLGTGDVAEFRAYRPASGTSEVAVTYEFADMGAYAHWYANVQVQGVLSESRRYCENISSELWGPSPVVPEPIRP